jgi:hypothetical protein
MALEITPESLGVGANVLNDINYHSLSAMSMLVSMLGFRSIVGISTGFLSVVL